MVELRAGDAFFHLNCHAEAELHLIKQGSGVYLIDGVRHSFSHNDLIKILPRQIHAITTEPKGHSRLSLTVQTDWLRMDADERRRFLELPPHIRLTDKDAFIIGQTLRRIEHELSMSELYRSQMVRALLHEFLAMVFRAEKHAENTPSTLHPVMTELLRFIHENYATELKVDALAHRAGYSRRHLSRIFRVQTGLSIKQYILHQRVMAARHLVEQDPELTAAAIAQHVGFSQFDLFNRVFKSVTGATLTEYRAMRPGGKGHPED